jgi:hypothetical protein
LIGSETALCSVLSVVPMGTVIGALVPAPV